MQFIQKISLINYPTCLTSNYMLPCIICNPFTFAPGVCFSNRRYVFITSGWNTIKKQLSDFILSHVFLYCILYIHGKNYFIFQTAWHFASARGLKFSLDHHNKDFQYLWNLHIKQKKTIQFSVSVCVEHGFVVNKTHTSIKKTLHKKIDLKI